MAQRLDIERGLNGAYQDGCDLTCLLEDDNKSSPDALERLLLARECLNI